MPSMPKYKPSIKGIAFSTPSLRSSCPLAISCFHMLCHLSGDSCSA
jgi:hypothetical protein